MIEYQFVPPEIIAGEASICSLWAMIAIAYVFQRNPKMNGWDSDPDLRAFFASRFFHLLPDTSGGAKYAFSIQDVAAGAAVVAVGEQPPKVVYPCVRGGLAFY
jgi:hypothetical protein